MDYKSSIGKYDKIIKLSRFSLFAFPQSSMFFQRTRKNVLINGQSILDLSKLIFIYFQNELRIESFQDNAFTLQTGPKPPCPSRFSLEKLCVACNISEKSKRVNSELFSSNLQTSSSSSSLLVAAWSFKFTFPKLREHTNIHH